MSRCEILIPDSGPLISFGKINALDLLLCLDMRILVVDAVVYETTMNQYRETGAIQDFIEQNALMVPTSMGRTFLDNLNRYGKRNRHSGELSILEFLVSERKNTEKPSLVLFEDVDILSKVQAIESTNTHYVSTVGYLRGLEKMGLIPSAHEVLECMEREGRVFKDKENPIDIPSDNGSFWVKM